MEEKLSDSLRELNEVDKFPITKAQLGENTGCAIRLQPGSLYAIECDRTYSQPEFDAVESYLAGVGEPHNIKFLLLEKGLKIAQ